ncbi:MAG: hypothetical protein EOO85_23440 [Pedobacter sp.]|nr:MAG: hypothetical protein EOO85_23440 [Pedobacter sp.]
MKILKFILPVLFFSSVISQAYPQNRKPNVILILTDDMGFSDISTFGGKFVPTPNIDALAKTG